MGAMDWAQVLMFAEETFYQESYFSNLLKLKF